MADEGSTPAAGAAKAQPDRPRRKSKTPAERADEFLDEQRRLKAEAAARRAAALARKASD
jgi:hypothetical protein